MGCGSETHVEIIIKHKIPSNSPSLAINLNKKEREQSQSIADSMNSRKINYNFRTTKLNIFLAASVCCRLFTYTLFACMSYDSEHVEFYVLIFGTFQLFPCCCRRSLCELSAETRNPQKILPLTVKTNAFPPFTPVSHRTWHDDDMKMS